MCLCVCLAEFALLAVSSKCKLKANGANFSDGEQNVLEHNEWFVGTTDTQMCSKNLSKMIYPLDKVLLVAACMNGCLLLSMNPFYPGVHRDIHIKMLIRSHQIALCRPSKLVVFSFQQVQQQNKKKEKKISVALLTKHKKRPSQRLNCFTPLHPPTLSFGRNNVAALLDCYPSPLMIFFNIFYFSCLNRCRPPPAVPILWDCHKA